MTISLVGYDSVKLARNPCNRCGSKSVAWRESKHGTWYLIEAFDFDGEWRANYKDFHSGYCKAASVHVVKQQQINEALGIQEQEEAELSVVAEQRKAAENARKFLALHDMCKSDPAMADRELTRRTIALAGVADSQSRKQLQTEIDFIRAALGMVTE